MKDEDLIVRDADITLYSPKGTPHSFTISIGKESSDGSFTRSFEVMGAALDSGRDKTREYHLSSVDHRSYIKFFESLSRDFGGRLPRNSQPFSKTTFRAAYRALLTENIAPGMLYGYGDPAVLRVHDGHAGGESWYYLLTTSNDAPDSFPITRSRDLVEWEFVGYVFPKGHKPRWAAEGELISDYWAPEMHKVRGEFRVYFVARHKNTRELCIGMSKSSRPEGPFSAEDEPILMGNVIDPHVFVENDDTAYLYWKEDNNGIWPSRFSNLLYKHPHLITKLFSQRADQITASFITTLWPWARTILPMECFFVQQPLIEAVTAEYSAFHNRLLNLSERMGDASIRDDLRAVIQVLRTPIYAQELSPDGARLVGKRTKIIENDQDWEAHLVEGIWVTKHDEKYYLFYAGNDFSTDQYGIGVAIADSSLGPYNKVPGPFLSSSPEWAGPGHPSVVIGPDGEPQLFLHAFFRGRSGYKEFRALLAAPIEFRGNGVALR
jgi:GH43 family beta-xylosidase